MLNLKWAVTPEFMEIMASVYEKRAGNLDFLKKESSTRIETYLRLQAALPDNLTVISCYGPIIPFANMISEMCGSVSVSAMRSQLKAALENDSIDTILFDFNSPGGAVEEINAFAQEIIAARSKKKIYAFTGGLCASAACWLATSCEKIFIDPTAEIGSIGVITWAAKSDENKIVLVNSDSYKKALTADSKDGQKEIIKVLDDIAEVFYNQVAAGRGATIEKIKELEGAVFVGATAVKSGLADELTDFDSLVKKLSEKEAAMPMTKEEQEQFDKNAGELREQREKNATLEKRLAELENEKAADKEKAEKESYEAAYNAKLDKMKTAGLKEENPVVGNFKAMFADRSLYAGRDWRKAMDGYAIPKSKLEIAPDDEEENGQKFSQTTTPVITGKV